MASKVASQRQLRTGEARNERRTACGEWQIANWGVGSGELQREQRIPLGVARRRAWANTRTPQGASGTGTEALAEATYTKPQQMALQLAKSMSVAAPEMW